MVDTVEHLLDVDRISLVFVIGQVELQLDNRDALTQALQHLEFESFDIDLDERRLSELLDDSVNRCHRHPDLRLDVGVMRCPSRHQAGRPAVLSNVQCGLTWSTADSRADDTKAGGSATS